MITYREPEYFWSEILSVLFPPKLPTISPEEMVNTANYQMRMTRNPKRTHVEGGPAAVISIGTAQEKRVFLLTGRTV
jgi:hypothetical protein